MAKQALILIDIQNDYFPRASGRSTAWKPQRTRRRRCSRRFDKQAMR